jgi:hypothetical protein
LIRFKGLYLFTNGVHCQWKSKEGRVWLTVSPKRLVMWRRGGCSNNTVVRSLLSFADVIKQSSAIRSPDSSRTTPTLLSSTDALKRLSNVAILISWGGGVLWESSFCTLLLLTSFTQKYGETHLEASLFPTMVQ